MYLLLYTVYRIISCIRNHKSFTKEENPYLCFKYYHDDKKSNKKSFVTVFKEVNTLCKYWHHFPDTYFMFCHYKKEYDNMQQLKTFLPQGSYEHFLKGGLDSSAYGIVVSDKVIFHELMQQYGIPVPHMLFVYKNNHFFAGNSIVSEEDVDRILQNTTDKRIFVKLPCAGAAKGVFLAKRVGDRYYLDNGLLNSDYIKQRFENQSVFFEKQLEQEPVFKSFNPDTINTIRILTLNYNGQMSIVSAAARFGRPGKFVDNMHAGGIGVSINLETGRLEEYGGRRFDPTKYYCHPFFF